MLQSRYFLKLENFLKSNTTEEGAECTNMLTTLDSVKVFDVIQCHIRFILLSFLFL